ncbi:MAG: hypothetical protein ACI9F9_000957 [Candidatus Paceibacteria bacterium]|jgi:hypothetical protein
MRAINVILAILVSLTIALGIFEVGFRLIGFAPAKTLNQFDETLGWVKRSDSSTSRSTSEFDVTFTVNSFGLRDDEMASPQKPEGTFRVICLGDSFTLGFTVEREDLFVDQLERKWNAEGRKVDVINTGTEGYSTDQEAVWLMENGDAFQPDLVLLFPYDNDIYWNSQTSYFGRSKPRFDSTGKLDHGGPFAAPDAAGLEKSLALANFWNKMFGSKPESQLYTPEAGTGPILKEHAPLILPPTGFVTDSVTRTGGALMALQQTCKDLGATLVVVPIPSHSAIDEAFAVQFGPAALGIENREDWMPDAPLNTVLELCAMNGIATLDAREALKAAMQETGQSMYFQKDWHLNPAGNLAFAEFLDRSLVDMGVFSADHAATAEATIAGLRDSQAPEQPMPPWIRYFLGLWVVLTTIYFGTYPEESKWQPPLKVGAMLALIFTIVIGGNALLAMAPPQVAKAVLILFVVWLLSFILYKLGHRLGTIFELLKSFTLRGHWYLMPLVVVLLSIGSLLVVAASSPLVAPFIYTLF